MSATPRRLLLLLTSLVLACGPAKDPGIADIGSADGQDDGAAVFDPTALAVAVTAASDALAIDQLMAHVDLLADDALQGRENGSPGNATARHHIIDRLIAMGAQPGVPAALGGGAPTWEQPFPAGVNVLGLLPGSDPLLRDQVVVIGAHYDHLGVVGKGACKANEARAPGDTVCNGALDNATGVAVLLELARVLTQVKVPLRRSLLFCFFDAEEDGLLGSHFYVDHPTVALSDVAVMFSVDLVGGDIFPGEPSSFAVDIEYSNGLRDVVVDAAQHVGLHVWPVSAFFVGQDDGGRSDHYPFRQKNVPELYFGSGSTPVYHTPADAPDQIDQPKLLATTRHVLRVVAAVANDDGRPVFNSTPKPHLGDAAAMIFLADQILADPANVGIADNKAALILVAKWREQLAAWLATPPADAAEWAEYDKLVRTIVTTAFAVLGQ